MQEEFKPKKQIPFLKQGIVILFLIMLLILIRVGSPMYIQSKSIDILDSYISEDGKQSFYSTPIIKGNNIIGEDILAKEKAIIIENNLHNFKVEITELSKKKVTLTTISNDGSKTDFSFSTKEKDVLNVPNTKGYTVQVNKFVKSKEVIYIQVKYAQDSIETFK